MCILLYFANRELAPSNLRLGCDIVMGGISFVVILLSLWWLSSKPDGPESDVQGIISRLFCKLKLRFKFAGA
jgi:hypothetical protein